MVVLPSAKVMEPVGSDVEFFGAATVAVIVTAWPRMEGLGEQTTERAGTAKMYSVRLAGVPAAKLALPL
jgi:hypothetical protein